MTARRQESLVALLFIAPAAFLIGLFVIWPMVSMALLSVHQQDWADDATRSFVAVDNYESLAGDLEFRNAVRNTAYFTLVVVPAQAVLALALAVWVNGRGAARRFLRIAVFVPTTVSLTVLSVLWALMYAPATATGAGLINGLLQRVGLPPQPFLTSPDQAMPAIIVMSIWQGLGLQMLIFLSGLQQIPSQLYESARLDGASAWRQFLHVTLPGVAPTGIFVVMITTVFAFKLFVQPYLMTGGGPQGATISVVQYMYEAAFKARDLGLACAAGMAFFVGVLVISLSERFALRSAEALE